LSISFNDFSAFAPSDISESFGAAVAANVAIRAVVVANSASELPLMLFTFLMILFSVCFIVLSFYGFGCFETSFFVPNTFFVPFNANLVPVLLIKWKIVNNPSEDEK
jgi:hypothetical protein